MSSASSVFHLSASHHFSLSAPIFGTTDFFCRSRNFPTTSAISCSSSSVDAPLMRFCFGCSICLNTVTVPLAASVGCVVIGSCSSMWVSVGDACPPSITLSGTIKSSPPSTGGRLLSALASFLVIQGPPTALCRMLALSSKLPLSFSVKSNSTYTFSSAPTIGSRNALILCCIIWRMGPRHSAYSARALSLLDAYVCVSLCQINDGLMP